MQGKSSLEIRSISYENTQMAEESGRVRTCTMFGLRDEKEKHQEGR